MQNIKLEYKDALQHVTDEEFAAQMILNESFLKSVTQNIVTQNAVVQNIHVDENKKEITNSKYQDSLGWLMVEEWAGEVAVAHLIKKSEKVREEADIFVLIGVGGSNQAARAIIKALQTERKPKIIYAGNNISAHYVNSLLDELEGKSVYINVIAKNFETLEPGIGFRILRHYLEKRYGEAAKERITVTGTKGSSLHKLAMKKGYDFLVFPDNIGGRYSVISDVGLYPMAVAGIDIKALVQGAIDMRKNLFEVEPKLNIALQYATYRNLLLQKGYNLEMMAFFEPQLNYFSKWWIQLFAESEGKQDKGIFPVAVNYSEDLHSVGQYIQEGQKIIFETFLEIKEQNSSVVLDKVYEDDGFSYLNGKDFWDINRAAYEATLGVHSSSGIPCFNFTIPSLNEYYFGQLFYLFEFACYLSGSILGINPFDQPGVENYKKDMFKKLGKYN
ncbi:MAG: glucose-6-phosphate isomerase [Mobilitalea sp.]